MSISYILDRVLLKLSESTIYFGIYEGLIYLFVAIVFTAILSPIIIRLLYKYELTVRHVVNKDGKNKEFVSIHGWKSGTPNLGGLIIIIAVPILTTIFVPLSPDIVTMLIGFVVLGIFGFLDNLFVDISKFNNKLRQFQDSLLFRISKLVIMTAIGVALGYFLNLKVKDFSFLKLFGRGFELEWMVVPIFGFVLSLAVYAFDIYDGADGLFSGTLIINLFGLILLLIAQGNLDYLPLLFIIMGTIIVFLYFNIPPARVWMGASGAMPIALVLFFVAFMTDNFLAFFIMSLMQWIVFASSFLQIISVRLFKKKLFKIAPLHHHFEAVGWSEYKVVMRFWLCALVFTLAGVLAGLWF